MDLCFETGRIGKMFHLDKSMLGIGPAVSTGLASRL